MRPPAAPLLLLVSARLAACLATGDFGLDLAAEPKYVVGVVTRAAAGAAAGGPGGAPSAGAPREGEVVVMTNAKGQRFSCTLPPSGAEAEAAEKPDDAPAASPDDILNGLGEQCFYRVEGWWTYEYCHRKHIRQFHKENEEVTADYVLGNFDAGATSTLREQSGGGKDAIAVEPSATGRSSKYVALVFTGGSTCDLTGEKRRVEARFFCGSEANTFIASLKEPATCQYTLQISTPLLCRHPSFGVVEAPVKYIKCEEVGGEGGGGEGGGGEGGGEGGGGGGGGGGEGGGGGGGGEGGGEGGGGGAEAERDEAYLAGRRDGHDEL